VEKVQYVFWGPPDIRSALAPAFLERLAPDLLALDPQGLSVDVVDAGSAIASPVPTPDGEQPHVAVVSLNLDCHDRRLPFEDVIDAFASGLSLTWAAYLVTEALYTDYGDNEFAAQRSWADGERSPGLLTVCLIHRPEGMNPDAWYRQWHDVQSPVSAEIQPRCRYVRNEVIRALSSDAPAIDGIVEEAWPSTDDVTDPMRFFCAGGDDARLADHIDRMMESVTAFIDMDRMRNECMGEYLIRTTGEEVSRDLRR